MRLPLEATFSRICCSVSGHHRHSRHLPESSRRNSSCLVGHKRFLWQSLNNQSCSSMLKDVAKKTSFTWNSLTKIARGYAQKLEKIDPTLCLNLQCTQSTLCSMYGQSFIFSNHILLIKTSHIPLIVTLFIQIIWFSKFLQHNSPV